MTTFCRPTRRAVTQSLVLGAASIASGVPSMVHGAVAAKTPGADWDSVADAGFKPAETQAFLSRTRAWIDSHTDQVIVIVSLVLGFWLIADSIYLIVS